MRNHALIRIITKSIKISSNLEITSIVLISNFD